MSRVLLFFFDVMTEVSGHRRDRPHVDRRDVDLDPA